MDQTTIASAVILPEPSEIAQTEPPSTLKRRQSSLDSNDTKRPRLSGEEHDDSRSPPAAGSNGLDRRRSSAKGSGGALEERKRGQRLFGAILGTLAQRSPSAGQRKRVEIEKKQQAKLRQNDEDDEHRKRIKREELLLSRKREQKLWNEQCMRTRHRNMLATARFLKTKAQPPLYYRPWDLRPNEEELIEQQIADAQRVVDREVAEFEERRRIEETEQADNERQQSEFRPPEPHMDDPDTHGGDGTSEAKDLPSKGNEEATKHAVQSPHHAADSNDNGITAADGHPTADDHGGEELVEGQEDDVIY